MNDRTLRVLEYDKIIDMLADHTVSAPGAEMARNLKPSDDKDTVLSRLIQSSEAQTVITGCGSSPVGEFPDIRHSLKRVGIRANLSATELLEIGYVLRMCKQIKDIFRDRDQRYNQQVPNIYSYASRLNPQNELMDEIFRCIEPDGHISDNASPELSTIRRNILRIQDKVKELLNKIIHSPNYQKYLQEPIITIRNDRYVVPVKQEHRSSVPGLIHDQSASGATLFIEPMPVVEANNDLREWGLKEKREIERILAGLSDKVRQQSLEISDSFEILAELDFIFAKGKLGYSMKGIAPKLADEPKITIINGRHPLIKPQDVVPISLNLGYGFNTLVVTGPNTGGKTVTLKTAGLFVLMTQAGLCIPADPGTEMGLFSQIFADIGDEQSIEQNLSTFSSHMVNIVSIINNADAGSLVLLDELGAGTDPTEGAALAMAILDYLHGLGVRTIATTHYSQLKVFAMTREGMENASMEFDVDSLEPTFNLLIGVPGKSNAFEISKRLGLKSHLIEKAKEFLNQEDIRLDDLISDMEYNRIKARDERQKVQKHLEDIEKLRDELMYKENRLESERHRILQKAREEARRVLRQAKEEADDIIRELNKLAQESAARERNREIERHRRNLKLKLEELDRQLTPEEMYSRAGQISANDIRLGETVYVSTLNQKGQVLTLPDENETVMIQVGIMKVEAKLSDLRRTEENESFRNFQASGKKPSPRIESITPEMDLRGQTVDEALVSIDKYLDDAFLSGLREVTLIHGKGTGALRDGIHQYLRRHPHVNTFRLGKYGEGESGVTVVDLK